MSDDECLEELRRRQDDEECTRDHWLEQNHLSSGPMAAAVNRDPDLPSRSARQFGQPRPGRPSGRGRDCISSDNRVGRLIVESSNSDGGRRSDPMKPGTLASVSVSDHGQRLKCDDTADESDPCSPSAG